MTVRGDCTLQESTKHKKEQWLRRNLAGKTGCLDARRNSRLTMFAKKKIYSKDGAAYHTTSRHGVGGASPHSLPWLVHV